MQGLFVLALPFWVYFGFFGESEEIPWSPLALVSGALIISVVFFARLDSGRHRRCVSHAEAALRSALGEPGLRIEVSGLTDWGMNRIILRFTDTTGNVPPSLVLGRGEMEDALPRLRPDARAAVGELIRRHPDAVLTDAAWVAGLLEYTPPGPVMELGQLMKAALRAVRSPDAEPDQAEMP